MPPASVFLCPTSDWNPLPLHKLRLLCLTVVDAIHWDRKAANSPGPTGEKHVDFSFLVSLVRYPRLGSHQIHRPPRAAAIEVSSSCRHRRVESSEPLPSQAPVAFAEPSSCCRRRAKLLLPSSSSQAPVVAVVSYRSIPANGIQAQ
jgi:hypothetical protein